LDLNLCILSFFKGTGGVSTYTFELARMLGLRGLKVHLVGQELPDDYRNLLAEAKVTYTPLNLRFSKTGYILPAPYQLYVYKEICKQVAKITDNKAHDILHFTSALYGLGFSGRKSVVTSWRSLSTGEFMKTVRCYGVPRSLMVGASYFQYVAGEKIVCEKTSEIVCPTKRVYSLFYKEFGEKAEYIPPPVSIPKRISFKSRNRDDRTRILFVAGDLSLPKKNLITFLRSIDLLSRAKLSRKISVVLVGMLNRRTMEFLSRRKRHEVKIRITGPLRRDALEKVYQNSDVLVFPSLHDDLSYAVPEAMAHGLPIVISQNLEGFDLVVNNVNGFFINPRNDKDLANKLASLVSNDDLIKKMGDASRKIIDEICAPEKVSQAIIKVYHDALD